MTASDRPADAEAGSRSRPALPGTVRTGRYPPDRTACRGSRELQGVLRHRTPRAGGARGPRRARLRAGQAAEGDPGRLAASSARSAQFSDSAKEDIRSRTGPGVQGLRVRGPEPQDFIRKHLLDNDELGLKEIRNGFDLKKEMAEVTDAVNGTESADSARSARSARRTTCARTRRAASATSDPLTRSATDGRSKDEPPPFDADAT